ncbi:MAG: HAD family phosphatase [Candidatus Aenigmarchaeota archaeon]|nr:HAD family phosphatase [Candidatus Aenigmarchaeota archaeon]
MTIKAVLFDMDGTIIDSELVHTRALQEVVKEELGIDLSEEEILKHLGLDYDDKLTKTEIKGDLKRLGDITRQRSVELSHLVKKMDGAEELIQRMKENFKIALVSGSSREQVESLSEAVGLKKYFDVRITSSDVENNKPYPDSYLLAARKLEVKPEECVAIEDTHTGIKAGKTAEMKCIAVLNRYNKNLDLSKADVIVNSLDEIDLDLIKSLE